MGGASDLDLSKEGGASLEAGPAHEGNDLLHRLPSHLCVEVFRFLSPSETAHCRQACVEWRERVSEPEVWSFFLDKTFHLSFASTYIDARRDYEHLACVCRNAQAFADQRVPAIVSPGGGGAAAAGGQQLPPQQQQAGEEFGGTAGPMLRRFAGHNKAVMALHVDELRDRWGLRGVTWCCQWGVCLTVRLWVLQTGLCGRQWRGAGVGAAQRHTAGHGRPARASELHGRGRPVHLVRHGPRHGARD